MNTSLPWANTAAASGPTASVMASAPIHMPRVLIVSSSRSVREGPQPQFFLADLPEPREAVRLHDQEEDDQRAEHHQLDLLLQGDRQSQPQVVRGVGQEDRDQHDEGGAEERAQDAAEAADDHHE